MNFRPEHFGLAAANPIALKDWYVRVLDAEVICQLNQTPPAFMLRLAGGFWIEIYQGEFARAETGGNQLPGWRHLALRVDSLENVRIELVKRGIEFAEPIKPAGGGGRVLFFRDGEGNLLHLVERTSGSAAPPWKLRKRSSRPIRPRQAGRLDEPRLRR